jgi:hypothetical protein
MVYNHRYPLPWSCPSLPKAGLEVYLKYWIEEGIILRELILE